MGLEKIPYRRNGRVIAKRGWYVVTASFDTIMDNGCITLAIRPLHTGHTRFLQKGDRPFRATIARGPILKPVGNRRQRPGRILIGRDALVGNNRICRSMNCKNGYRSPRMTTTWKVIVIAGNGGKGSNAHGKFTGQETTHATTV